MRTRCTYFDEEQVKYLNKLKEELETGSSVGSWLMALCVIVCWIIFISAPETPNYCYIIIVCLFFLSFFIAETCRNWLAKNYLSWHILTLIYGDTGTCPDKYRDFNNFINKLSSLNHGLRFETNKLPLMACNLPIVSFTNIRGKYYFLIEGVLVFENNEYSLVKWSDIDMEYLGAKVGGKLKLYLERNIIDWKTDYDIGLSVQILFFNWKKWC